MGKILKEYLAPADDPALTEGYSVVSLRRQTKSTEDTPEKTDGKTPQPSEPERPLDSRTPEEIEKERLELVEHAIKFRRENNITGI